MAASAEGGTRTLKLTVALYVGMFGMKLAVYFMTGIMAMLAEALHTLSDIFVSGFLLVAAIWSEKTADEEHQYGHGRAQYVGALVASTLFISFTSLELFREAVPALFKPRAAPHGSINLAIGVLIVSMLLTSAPLINLLRQRSRGAVAKAQLLELINDQLGLLAALVGTLCVAAGMSLADPISALVVGTIIAVNGAALFKENLSYLLGKSPGVEFIDNLKRLALSVPGVVSVRNITAQVLGQDRVQSQLRIVVASDLSLADSTKIAHQIAEVIRSSTPCQFCYVHMHPADLPMREATTLGEP